MSFKYKKLILIFTIAIMFIGLGTFSLIAPSINFSIKDTDNSNHINSSNNNSSNDSDETIKSTVTSMSESEVKTAISSLVENYLDAKQRVDMDKLSECVSDVENMDNKRLVAEAEYIEQYRNIECTIKKGPEDGTYRVYAYYDVKVYDIDTLVPSLTALYIKTDSDGTFKIYLGTIDDEVQEAITKLDNSEEVKTIVDSVQKKLEEIVSTNEDVKDFYEMLESTNESNEAVEENENIDKEGNIATTKPKS